MKHASGHWPAHANLHPPRRDGPELFTDSVDNRTR